MTKIKYIHCLGTSFTAGGGFEFDGNHTQELRRSIYKNVNEELTQYNFSYPGQLQKLVGKKKTVLNHAKQGYGDSRLIRKSYDIINKFDFNTDENLFIFEFAGLGRDEFFFKDLNSYIVCNYGTIYKSENEIDFEYKGSGKSYNYDTPEIIQKIEKYDDFFKTYLEHFSDFKEMSSKIMRDADMFLTYLESKNINFLFSISPMVINHYDTTKEIEFGDGKYFKKSTNFVQFMDFNKLSITDETSGRYHDGHCGIKANKITADCIYNKLVECGYIDSQKNIIDWEWYHKKDFLMNLI